MNERLKEARDRLGLTQAEVAEKAGIPTRTYQNCEYTDVKPNVVTAIKIAKVLKSTVEKLFTIST